MADIDIQRKDGPGMWPWIIGALALVLVIGAVIMFTGNDDTARADRNGEPATPAAEQTWPADPGPTYQDPAGTSPGTTTPVTPPPPPTGTGADTVPGATRVEPGTDPGATTPPGTEPRI